MATSSDSGLPPRVKDLTGRVFGLLTVKEFWGINDNRAAEWRCVCDCGKEAIIDGRSLTRKFSRSCGCYRVATSRRVHTKHGESYTDIYWIWSNIRKRTRVPGSNAYERYGGAGIVMSDEFFDSFEAFRDHLGPRPSKKHTVDRIDGKEGYVRGNLRWATYTEQARNRKDNRILSYAGIECTVAEWAEKTGIPSQVIRIRIDRLKWTVEKAIVTPLREHKKAPRHFGREAEDFVTG